MSQVESSDPKITIKDLNTENPRWCAGCGDFGIVMGVKRFMVDEQILPHQTVNVSGIGCSGRAPFYFNTYGVHSIHGRAATVGLGVALANPDLNLIIHSGDGDSMSIGGNHLIHAINKNFNCTYIMYDNELYALTKNQTSPMTRKDHKTMTQPTGTYLEPMKALNLVIGAGAGFVASTADWMPDHLVKTLKAAHAHKGFSFVHISQRCPHFDPNNFDHKSSAWFSFLDHENGISPDKRLADKTEVVEHDPSDTNQAFHYADSTRSYFGLFYRREDKPRYDEILHNQVKNATPADPSKLLDQFVI